MLLLVYCFLYNFFRVLYFFWKTYQLGRRAFVSLPPIPTFQILSDSAMKGLTWWSLILFVGALHLFFVQCPFDVLRFVEARNVMEEKPPFSGEVAKAIGCPVCYQLVANAIMQLDFYKTTKNKTELSVDEVDDYLENICDSYSQAGAWIRKLGIFVQHSDPENSNSSVYLAVMKFDQYSYCKRTCATVEKVCEFMTDYTIFDTFSMAVANMSSGALVTDVNLKFLLETYCEEFQLCQLRDTANATLTRLLNTPESSLRKSLQDEMDRIEIVSPSEYNTEFPFKTTERSSIEQFTSDEVRKIQEEIARKESEAADQCVRDEEGPSSTENTVDTEGGPSSGDL